MQLMSLLQLHNCREFALLVLHELTMAALLPSSPHWTLEGRWYSTRVQFRFPSVDKWDSIPVSLIHGHTWNRRGRTQVTF